MATTTRQPKAHRLSDWLMYAYALICGLWAGAAFVATHYARGGDTGGLTPLMIGSVGLFLAYMFGNSTSYTAYMGRIVVMAAGMGVGYFFAALSHLPLFS